MASTFAIQIDTRQLDQIANGLSRLTQILPIEVDKAIQTTAYEGSRLIIEKTPKITGNLKRGFLPPTGVQRISPMLWRIFNNVKYFMFIETGKRGDKRWPGKVIKRKAGAAKMMERSQSGIATRLNFNIERMIDRLLARPL